MAINFSPNPFTTQTAITFSRALKDADIYIYDVSGKLVWKFQGANGRRVNWKAEGVRSGVYLLKVKAAGQVYHKKLLVQR